MSDENPFDSVFESNPFDSAIAAPATKMAVPAAGGDNLIGWLQQAGFKGSALKTAWAIAKRESGGRPSAFNPDTSTGDQSYGLFQINMLNELGPDRRKRYGLSSNEALLDPATNARVAYAMSKGGTDFGPWGIGPNAYRKMPALDFSGFPGGELGRAPSRTGSVSELGRASVSLDPDNPFAEVFASRPGALPSSSSSRPAPVNMPKGEINTSTWTGHGTHVTDGLDLNHGQKTAVDIMAKPGTAVGAPADGVVLRLGSAQGGDSVYFRDDQGYVWWLGHVDSNYSLPAGTRVRAGEVLTRVSANHAAPHLHLDRTLVPTRQFG